ncbi:MAG: ATP-binding cassette domain-containing protein [Armatimonadetes bacterium]|nr:ATP-binding cassette domain-containing protein [Armatimonadota bacterium]
MIAIKNASKFYGEDAVVDDLSLDVVEGEVCVIVGPPACGKTTTLRMISRSVEPFAGHILVGDRDISGLRPEELPALVVLEPSMPGAAAARELTSEEVLRAGMERALASNPPALLMDDPFSGVDPLSRGRLWAEFLRIQRECGKTIIFATRDVYEAIRIGDRVAVMREGTLEQYDTPKALLDRPVDSFVKEFVEADRSLEYLDRTRVADVMRSPAVVFVGAEEMAFRDAAGRRRFVYVLERDGRLVGWMDARGLTEELVPEQMVTHVDPGSVSVSPNDMLRDAFSRMLGLGYQSIAVTDSASRLVGEVTFASVEAAMADQGMQ